jgi:hypothetical protein
MYAGAGGGRSPRRLGGRGCRVPAYLCRVSTYLYCIRIETAANQIGQRSNQPVTQTRSPQMGQDASRQLCRGGTMEGADVEGIGMEQEGAQRAVKRRRGCNGSDGDRPRDVAIETNKGQRAPQGGHRCDEGTSRNNGSDPESCSTRGPG